MLKYAVIFIAGFVIATALALHTDVALSQEAGQPKNVLSKKCTLCHSLGRVQNDLGTKDAAQWQATIQKMRSKGARLNDQEQNALAKYLGGLQAGDTL